MNVAIVYYSGTGNTEVMAEEIRKGCESAGAHVQVIAPQDFSADRAKDFDAIAFGCPSMGVEELEDDVFEPMFASVLPVLSTKRVALFGSYGWGDGEWMRTWEQRTREAGIVDLLQPVIANEMPDEDARQACRSLGTSLVS